MKITDKITLTFEDRMKLLSRLADKSIHVAVLDPEYGINATKMSMGSVPGYNSTATKIKGRLNSGGGKLKNRKLNQSLIEWDNDIPPKEFFDEIFRVSINQIIFGGNYFPLPPTRGIGFWDKLQPWQNFSQFEMIWTSFDCPAFKIECSSRGGANTEEKIHPTQKPVYVYKYLLNKFAKSGDMILDTGFGSASIAIACHDMGLDLIACENKEIYYKPSIKRVQRHVAQLSLFEPKVLTTNQLFPES
ncbi:site-specific DNA-methyltransferase [Elizabethkingia anophelis]|uniref:DNA methyltransferase n=1 Tax=Elizabethkingia anophelis TaxID=1117645 RepID=UPI00187E2BCF|nr:DNA methyltransferase [Elizabethkingia anophelis]MBE9391938.1 site-specific DNA-methyltransferase [Elizabethkingia anophelis]MBE9405378.1 site-specific DNA-methyltransferase [Elizabethkingia anophelis]MDV3897719.1 DNA modification methylase [Elizabethkingia anophelis]